MVKVKSNHATSSREGSVVDLSKEVVFILFMIAMILLARPSDVHAATLSVSEGAVSSAPGDGICQLEEARTLNSQRKAGLNKGVEHGDSSGKTITAYSEMDFKDVCSGAAVSNAAPIDSPYKIGSYYIYGEDDYWSNVSAGYGEPYYPDYREYTSINVVACLTPDYDTMKKEKTCDIKTDTGTVSMDYYSLQYDVAYYEAKTGKRIDTSPSRVSASNVVCPTIAGIYEQKIFAIPDDYSVVAAHNSFVSR